MDWWKGTQHMSRFDEIEAILKARGKQLTCDMFKDSVAIRHQDGSFFDLKNVIIAEHRFGELDVYLVWTEHCGYFYFFKDDLEYIHRYGNEVQKVEERSESSRGVILG